MFASTDSSLFGRLHERVRRVLFAALCFWLCGLPFALKAEATAGSSPASDFQQSLPHEAPLFAANSTGTPSGQPLLRILFSGNTRGALFPCPT